MTVSTLFEVKSNMQLDTDINTPGIVNTPGTVLFNVAYVNTVNTLREGNETAASIKPDDEDGWFMLWGCLSIGLALSALAMAEHTYRHCNNPHRQRGSANGQAVHHPGYELPEETKEAGENTNLGPPVV